jgi:hypothetical protein
MNERQRVTAPLLDDADVRTRATAGRRPSRATSILMTRHHVATGERRDNGDSARCQRGACRARAGRVCSAECTCTVDDAGSVSMHGARTSRGA